MTSQHDDTVAWVSDSYLRHGDSAAPHAAGDGGWILNADLAIAVTDVGFRQGVVAVERLRTYQGVPLAVESHLVRWRRTLEHVGIRIDSDSAVCFERIERLIERNRAWCDSENDFGITMLATPGTAGPTAAGPIEILHLNRLDHAKIAAHRQGGQPLVITDVQAPPEKTWPRDIKVRCRLHYYVADRIAAELNPAAIGVLVDADGSVTETSVANLAILRDGTVVSPPAERVLPGVTQELVMEIAAELDIAWTHAPLYPADLRTADEVWLMGTDGGLWFANAVDGVAIHAGAAGQCYLRVLDRFDRCVRSP